MSTHWTLERIEQIRLERLQERIGLRDREVISMALDVGFSALERSVERAQDRVHRAAIALAEEEAAEREKRSFRKRWRGFKDALTATWAD